MKRAVFIASLGLMTTLGLSPASLHAQDKTARDADKNAATEPATDQADTSADSDNKKAAAPEKKQPAQKTGDKQSGDKKSDNGDAQEPASPGGGKMTAGLIAGLGSGLLCAPGVAALGILGPSSACLLAPPTACAGFGVFASVGVIAADVFNKRDTTLKSMLIPALAGMGVGAVLTGANGFILLQLLGTSWNNTSIIYSVATLGITSVLGAIATGVVTAMLYNDGSDANAELADKIHDAVSPKKDKSDKEQKAPETKPETTPQNIPGPDTGFYY